MLPALRASGAGGHETVLRSGRGSTRQNSLLRRSLLIGEVAVATVLLSGSGLMVHTMLRLSRVDPGFDPHNLQTVMFSLAGPAWPDPRKQAFFAEAVERLRAVPGVENAAITYSLPILGSNWWNWFTVAGRPVPPGAVMMDLPSAGIVPVSATYFETLKIPVIKGRSFDRSDTPDSQPVAIINASLANLYWKARAPGEANASPAFVRKDEDPIGQQIRLAGARPTEGYGPWRTIVGIVGDVKQHGLDQDTPQQIFLPVVQQTRTTVFAVARTRGTVSSSSIETAIRDLDRSVPVFNDRTVEQVMREAASRRRVAAIVLSVFAGAAVLLAAIGLYGVIAQSVSERRQEIGVRMALGATGGQILRLFLRHGLIVVAVGIGVRGRRGDGRGSEPRESRVRRHRDGSCDARHGCRAPDSCHAAGVLRAGAVRHPRRSIGSAAIGVMPADCRRLFAHRRRTRQRGRPFLSMPSVLMTNWHNPAALSGAGPNSSGDS